MSPNENASQTQSQESQSSAAAEDQATESYGGRAKFETLLDYLRRSHGFDFTGYKRSTLMRRIIKRNQQVGIRDFGDYMDYLEGNPLEFTQLFNTILINVTRFFRDPQDWEYIAFEIIPRIANNKVDGEAIRIWSAGCASGEEPYTIAILLAEALGMDAYCDRVKIFATDVDEEALAAGRQASYTAKQAEDVPSHLLEKYFEPSNGRFVLTKDLRRGVIFGRHDLIQDPPISRIDLLICRNTLMYLNSDAQRRVMERFQFALKNGGYIFLGKAETLFTHGNSYLPIDLKRRIFVKTPGNRMREHLPEMARVNGEEWTDRAPSIARILEITFEVDPLAQLVFGLDRTLLLANERARTLFGLTQRDMGHPVQELELWYRPPELRSQIEQAYAERRSKFLREAQWHAASGEIRWFDVQVIPLVDPEGQLLGIKGTFSDATQVKRLREDLERINQERETAYEELQSSNEELETTNEELQSTIEELETTNEELQSTNEELETMNEELQSTNEELHAANDELQQRSEEVHELNAYLESILGGIRSGIAVLDGDLHIRMWNRHASELWGLRADEVQGKPFLNLDIGLPVEQLKQPIRTCLIGEADYQEVIVNAINRRGKSILCQVTCTSLRGYDKEIRGVILAMEEREAPE